MVTDAGAKAKYEANAKAVDQLVRSLCDPEFERVRQLLGKFGRSCLLLTVVITM
jgi:hypothetical protein